jgi:lipid-A-disaccharide synthase-like uncharacterized protein
MSFMDSGTVVVIAGLSITITGWKICGWLGAGCFALRWIIQAWHRRRTGSAVIPLAFWLMSVFGAALTLLYFVYGKNDSVGIIQNALPLSVALYNVWLDLARRSSAQPASD